MVDVKAFDDFLSGKNCQALIGFCNKHEFAKRYCKIFFSPEGDNTDFDVEKVIPQVYHAMLNLDHDDLVKTVNKTTFEFGRKEYIL